MIDPLWWLVLIIGAGTYLWRGSFVVFGGRLRMPDLVRRGLNYVPAAVFAALVLPGLVRLTEDGQLDGPRFAAGAVAALVAWRTQGTIATLVAGMVMLWVLRALAGLV